MLTNLWFDLKCAWRPLLKLPSYALLHVVVVALSVAVPVFTWELAYSQAFRELPFPGADRWYSVQLAADTKAEARPGVDPYTHQAMVARARGGRFLGAFASRSAVLSTGADSARLRAGVMSPGLMSALGSAPAVGRLLDAADAQPGAPPAVVISHDTWQTYFAGDPGIVGKYARIDAQPVQVVGVMPRDLLAFEDFELWRPLALERLAEPGDAPPVSPLVVLGDGESLESVRQELQVAVDEVNRAHPRRFAAGRHVMLYPVHQMATHGLFPVIATVNFTGLAVLLLGCVNISMVFLARLLERGRELALRTALGSSRRRLLRQCLLESLPIVVLGLLLALVIDDVWVGWAQALSDFEARMNGSGRSVSDLTLRPGDAVVAVLVASLLWLLSTLVPAWRISRQDAATVLAGSGKGAAGPAGARTASVLVGLEVVVSSMVLVLCANLMLAINEEAHRPLGLDTSRVLVTTLPTVFDARYADPAARRRYWEDLTGAVQGRIGGAEVAYSASLPSRPSAAPAVIEGQDVSGDRAAVPLPITTVSDGYFSLLGIELRSGRLFDATDGPGSLPVAVVDERTARRHWPGQSPVGKRIQLGPDTNGPWLTVVGVVSAVARPYSRYVGVVYRPLRQAPPDAFHLIAKLPPGVRDGRASLRAAAFAVDRDLPLENLQTLADFIWSVNLNFASLVPFFGILAVITVILAASGLYGLISRSVARRTQEVGIRRAMGGTEWQVAWVFLRQGLRYWLVGLGGGALGVLVTSLLTSSIPNALTQVVPATAGVFALLAVVIVVASFIPTRRAVALEPGDALRYE